jgi:hypothetical protein
MEQPVISGQDNPWQAATAKMDALPTRPAIDRERLTPNMYVRQPKWYFPIGESYGPSV